MDNMERPGHEQIRQIINELFHMTNGWDSAMAREGVAVVGMFDQALSVRLGKLFEAGREVRLYLEERGL